MKSLLNHLFADSKTTARKSSRPLKPRRRLGLEGLEVRDMMSAVPVLNSLPGAPNTIYLDFDGDFQAIWSRNDPRSKQTYLNIASGEFNRDNTPGFSTSELNDIRQIWQGVAEDYAPFNVNVTTVEPKAADFATNKALRVVIGGTESAMLLDPHFFPGTTTIAPFEFVNGTVFITNDRGLMVGQPMNTSGYSSIGCYNDAEPNVVFAFAGFTDTWGNTDDEKRPRDYNQLVANTASHEAGHAFGLHHHQGKNAAGKANEYDVGEFTTTPIMGDNTSADRTIWSQTSSEDSVQMLHDVLGWRPDDYASSSILATQFPYSFTKNNLSSYGSVNGVISTSNDTDWFRFTTDGGRYNFNANPLQFGNLNTRLELYADRPLYLGGPSLIAYSDPATPANQPWSGLNASISQNLDKGNYFVVVRGHGGYGDMGHYTLTASRGIDAPALIGGFVVVPYTPSPYATMSAAIAPSHSGGGAGSEQAPLGTGTMNATDPASVSTTITPKSAVLTDRTARIRLSAEAVDRMFGDHDELWG
jgi:hypothetical protein